MAKIGLGGVDTDLDTEEEELQEGEKLRLRNIQKDFKIPAHRIEEIKAEFDCVVVRDFGDEYHLSEEERIEKNEFYKVFSTFNKAKHKYGKLDEYVKVVREGLKCLDAVAENNGVYSPKKFKKLFFRGDIVVTGLKFPKYIGKDRKQISWEYLTDFILSDRDPSEILPKKDKGLVSPEDIAEKSKTLFDPGELERILEPETEEERRELSMQFDPETDEIGDKNIVVYMSRKETRDFIKSSPEFMNSFKELRRDMRQVENLSQLACDFISEDIEAISEYDRKHNFQTSGDMPEFNGDIMDDNAYYKYLQDLDEWELHNTFEYYNGRTLSLDKIEELRLKEVLEEGGFNIMKFYGIKDRQKKLKKIQKKEDKRISELKKKFVKLQNRRKRSLGEDVDDDAFKKKKKKKKRKKYEMDKDRAYKEYKESASNSIDEILLDVAQRSGDFDDYEEEVLDFSWDKIIGG